jgi:hypothetical protein
MGREFHVPVALVIFRVVLLTVMRASATVWILVLLRGKSSTMLRLFFVGLFDVRTLLATLSLILRLRHETAPLLFGNCPYQPSIGLDVPSSGRKFVAP